MMTLTGATVRDYRIISKSGLDIMTQQPWRPAISPGVRVTVLDGEAVLFDGANERVHQLDAVGTSMLQACNGSRSVEEIVAHLLEAYDVEESLLRSDTCDLLMRLQTLGVLT
jgi:hypothetical protein